MVSACIFASTRRELKPSVVTDTPYWYRYRGIDTGISGVVSARIFARTSRVLNPSTVTDTPYWYRYCGIDTGFGVMASACIFARMSRVLDSGLVTDTPWCSIGTDTGIGIGAPLIIIKFATNVSCVSASTRRRDHPQRSQCEKVLRHARVPEPALHQQGPDTGVCQGTLLWVG